MTNFTHKRARAAACFALGLALLLTACSLPQFGGTKKSPAGTAVAAAASTTTPSAGEATETAQDPSSEPSLTPDGVVELTASDFADPGGTASRAQHGLILFTSTEAQPFSGLTVGAVPDPTGERYLWAISLDGKHAGRISPDGLGSALHLPIRPKEKARVIANGFTLPAEQFESVVLPEECRETADGAAGPACSGYQFSPNGSLLAYFSGPESCGRKLNLMEIDTRSTNRTWDNVHWAYFMKDGSLVISLGDCQSQTAYLYIPKTGKQAGIAKVGEAYWNATHTAALFRVQGKPELQAGMWGLNLETSRVFLWAPDKLAIEDTPIWLADGQHFVFQHRLYRYDGETKQYTLEGPRQVILMDAWTRDQRQLAYDFSVDYHLCETTGQPCEQPYGDWLKVRRSAFQPMTFIAADRDSKPEIRCALYGIDCTGDAETLALNWKTGELVPWNDARVPQSTPTSAFTEPALESEPIYADPAGEFTFFLGKDGKSLWYQPRDREANLWVKNGEDFIYLP